MNEKGRRDHCYASHPLTHTEETGRQRDDFGLSSAEAAVVAPFVHLTHTHALWAAGPSLVGISPPHRGSLWGVCCSAPLQGPGNAGVRHFFPLTSIFGLDIGGSQPHSFSTVFQPYSFPASTAHGLLLQIQQHNLQPTEAMWDTSEAARIWADRKEPGRNCPAAGPRGSNQCLASRVDLGHR